MFELGGGLCVHAQPHASLGKQAHGVLAGRQQAIRGFLDVAFAKVSDPFRVREEMETRSDVVEHLQELEHSEEPPFMVEVEAHDAIVAMGVGAPESVMSFMSASLDPPYWASEGSNEAHDETLVFEYAGVPTEYPAWSAIPYEQARAAFLEFLASGQRPTSVHWREV